MCKKTKWIKAYVGPFTRKEAIGIAESLHVGAKPEVNGIYAAAVRRRKLSNKYDVYIKIEI